MSEQHERRRALLIGVSTSEGHQHPLATEGALDRVAGFLSGRLGFEVECCLGPNATRDGMLTQLEAWVDRCRADASEACLLYYFGHGGRVHFEDQSGLAGEEHGYLTCRPSGAGFEAVLGLEISARLAPLAGPARSTVVILDCCYSGQVVRQGSRVNPVRRLPAPAWAQATLARDHAVAVDSHPDIIRLVGSSPKTESFLRRQARGQIGELTHALLASLDALGEHWQQTTWDALGHMVRQRVIEAVGEGQWVGLAGPRDQLLFSARRSEPPSTVGFVPDRQHGDRGWVRAGALQGLRVGDLWAVTCPWLDEGETRTKALATARITAVELNRAQLRAEGDVDLRTLGSNAAEPWPRAPRSIVAGRWLETLEGLLAQQMPNAHGALPLSWRWGVVDGPELPHEHARVHAGDRIWMLLQAQEHRARHWYVNLVFVTPSGRAWLL
ncbi:MAG: caspase family protein, partial [Myxococcales bacterium]|nr:caspase family protein [Myxococcales bacterium]